jgi:hypothetical protein
MSNGDSNFVAKYVDALKGFLPAGLLATYLSVDGVFALLPIADAKLGASWAVFILCLVAIPLWMKFYEKSGSAMKIVFAMVSFVLLVFAAGGPLALTFTEPDTINTIKGLTAGAAMLFTGLIAPIVAAAVGPSS